ncbi:unnamed protein product [Toxocara canis]|uniref:EB domain-containing protein n=1 Tax=Toxocara canis TaxID=6265 RepID=A0A183U720_TOXCA|nr:unnamed protein product [Toxocara canis]
MCEVGECSTLSTSGPQCVCVVHLHHQCIVEFEDGSEDHTLQEYENMALLTARVFEGHSFGDARISTPSLCGANTTDVAFCDRMNNDFERKYTNNGFSGIRLKNDVVNFLPSVTLFPELLNLFLYICAFLKFACAVFLGNGEVGIMFRSFFFRLAGKIFLSLLCFIIK